MNEPSPNGSNGERDSAGRFAAGNRGGPGNPFAGSIHQIRSALMEASTPEAVKEICERLVADARRGDKHARAEYFDRMIGRPVSSEILEMLATVKAELASIRAERAARDEGIRQAV